MTAYDRAEVIRDLQDCRRNLASLKRDSAFALRIVDQWRCKAVAADIAGDEDSADFAATSANWWNEEAHTLHEEHALLLAVIRALEKELTR